MRKNLNRFLSWALAIIMILGMLPTTAFAAEDEIISATDNLIAVTDESADTGAAIETEEDLIAALAAGGEIVVAKDMTLNEDITIPAGVTVTVNEGYTLRVLGTLTNNGTINGAGRVAVSVMVYIVEEKAEYNVTSTKNGAVEGTAPECTVAYEISLDGGASWITDTTGGKAQAVLVKTDGAKTVYSSFQSAYTSAKTGEIVHVLKDVHVQSTNTKKNYGPLFSYYGLILEGNGHTIYTDLESSGASNEYATLKFSSYLAGTGPEVDPVLKNVTIDSQNNAKADLDFVSGDVTFTVTMYNVNLLGNCQYASFAMKSSSMIINKSNVEIFDCTIPSWDAGSAKAIDIYSGDYSLSLNNKCTVYGGTFTKDVTSYLAEGVVLVKDEDGKYVAQADPAYGMVAKVGDTYYETLSDAVKAAVAGDTISLLADVALTEVLTVNVVGDITIDGNGYTVTMDESFAAGSHWSAVVLGNTGLTENSGYTYTVKNVTFDGVKNYTALRTQAINLNMVDCTVKNSNVGAKDLISTVYTDATFTNVVFDSNVAGTCINFNANANGESVDVLNVNGCTFTNNHCSVIGLILGQEGRVIVIADNAFIGNTTPDSLVFIAANGSVTGNYFSGNTIVKASVVAGPWTAGEYEIAINKNAFLDENVPGAYVEDWAAQYSAITAFNLNSNYWNGGEPVYGVTGEPTVALDNYYTECAYKEGVLTLSEQLAYFAGLKGSGTEEDPYQISTLEELEWFRDQVNSGNTYKGEYVKLTADINLGGSLVATYGTEGDTWTPIGDYINKFMGTFDGDGKTISNLVVSGTSYIGLFGVMSDYGTIKNVNIENVALQGVSYVGAVVGMGYTGTIENCHVSGVISIVGNYMVGGINGHGYAKIRNCSVIGDGVDTSFITATHDGGSNEGDNVGGIVGHNGENNEITNCTVKNVTVSGTRKVGGIVGIANMGTKISGCTVENVVVETTATVDYANDNLKTMSIGGIVGQYQASGSNGTVSECTVSNLTFANENGVTVSAGALTGGMRGTSVILAPTADIDVSGTTVASVTGATNDYLFVAQVNGVYYVSLQAALDAAAAGTGNVTVEILCDVDLSGVDWNPVTVSAPGYPEVTVNGNNKTITGLNDMLFGGTWAGGSGLIINDLTIKDSTIVNDENDEKGTVGVGAFIGYPQASATITLNNCHLVDSTVKGGHWTGGLIGMAGGYNGNDGPVFMNLTIKDCSVTGSTITGKGSAGGVIGHGSCAAWTNVTITGTTVSGNTITSTGSSTNKAGSVMGTIGAAGQATTAAGQTLTGGAFVSATVSDNTVTSGDTTITTIYGRQGTSTGVLTLTGGSYDSYPIEENVTYAAPSEGCVISETDGTYSVREETHLIIVVGPVATMSTTTVTVATMDEAIAYAQANPADNVTYQITGPVELTTGYSHGILDLGSNVTIEGVTDEAKLTIVGGGVPDIQGVTFKNLTIADEGEYLTTANEFMYQNFIDCTFENVTFEDGIRLSGTSVLADCTVNANTANEYAIWLDAGDFTMTGSKVTAGSEAYGVIKSDEVSTITLTGNTFEYLTAANKEALNVKGAAITAENNTFINCTEGVVPADKTNYGADGTTEITDAAIKENNTVVIYVAQIGETKYESLAEAFTAAQDGDEVKILMAGTYALSTSGKDITITGAVDGVVFDNIGAKNMGGANVTFNNVTFNYAENSTYKGLQHAGNLVYNNCTINGQVFLYGTSETFNNCTFNTTDADNYNVWTYGAKAVEFNGCTFNCAGKSVLIYSESNALYNDVTVTDCDFIASASVDGKAAIEMDSSLTAGIKLTIDAATTTSGFGTGNVSGNSLWNNKKDNKTEANNDITVVVAGETVLAPVAFVAKIGDIGYVTIADAISAAKAGETVRILAGEYDAFSVNKAITVVGETDAEGNNLVTINGKLSVTGTGVTVKNLNVNNSSERALYVSGGDILIEGCSLTGVHGLRYCYANNGDVTLKDCVITGTTYGVHFDAGSGEGNVIIDGCTITGWTSFGSAIEGVTITNTTFCDGNYDVLRFYQNATISGSTFDPATTIDFGKNAVELEITDSTVSDGSALTDVIYLGDIVNMGVSVTIDSESVAVEASVISGEDTEYYLTLTEAFAAAQDGDTVMLHENIALTDTVIIDKAGSITIDGNGKTITLAEGFDNKNNWAAAFMLGNSTYGDADAANHAVTFRNVVFDGVTGYSLFRTQGVTLTVEGCTVSNCDSTATDQGLLRIDSTVATITNTEFVDNKATKIVGHNHNTSGSSAKVVMDDCLFQGNIISGPGVIVLSSDAGCTINDSEFVGNKITCTNGATVYMGFTENNVITSNLFQDNVVTGNASSGRVAGALFVGFTNEISGNAFVNNTATNASGSAANDVCVDTIYALPAYGGYALDIDLSENYWDGSKPVEGVDYTVNSPITNAYSMDSYYTAYTLDTEGNVVLDGLTYLPSADMTYSAYGFGTSGEGEKYRENVMIDLYGVNAYNSLVLELYSNGELIATVSRRASDRDDETALLFPVTGNAATTVNIVVAGRLAGSWDTDWIKNPSVACIPDTVKVYADGELVDIYTDALEAEDRAAYTALSGVYKAASVTDKAGIVTYYATLAEAFAAAQSSETVKLMVDCTEGYVMVTPGATLDLNGFKLTCSGLAVFKGSHVIDSSADTTGLLIVPQDNLSLQADNKELPVWNENAGYVFVTPNTSAADRYQYFYAVTDNSFDLRFRPGFGYANEESVKDAYFKTNGGADNGLKMVLRLSWTNNDGNTIHHDVEFTDELFEKAYQDGQGFKVMVTGTGAFGEITVNAVIVSDTGVEFVGEDIIYTPAMADDAE